MKLWVSFALPFVLLISGHLLWAEEPLPSVTISEKSLIQMSEKTSPVRDGIRAKQSAVDLEKAQLESAFETRAHASYMYSESREEGLASFIPIFSPQRNIAIGLSKQLPVGMNVKVEGFGEQINAPSANINNATRSGVRLNLEVDLLKNFFPLPPSLEKRRGKTTPTIINGQWTIDKI